MNSVRRSDYEEKKISDFTFDSADDSHYQPFWGTRGEWTFWQYTDTAVLEGYEGEEKYIDRNVFRGTKEELQEILCY